jgi:transposase
MERTRLANLVNARHPMVRLARQIDWQSFDEHFGVYYRGGKGRPAISTRLMVSLHYLKYTHDLSDEAVLAGWVENPYWQYLSGMEFFEYDLPIDPSSMSRWRSRVGEAGAGELLKETIEAGLRLKIIKPSELRRVNVDTTVQEKHIRFPTDPRLYDRMRQRLVAAQALEGNPYDGHTLQSTMDRIVATSGTEPEHVYCDMGYRGHDYEGECKVHVGRRKRGSIAKSLWRWMRRRAAIEPSIGHLKEDRRMERCRLKGAAGDKVNAVLSAAAMNFSKLLAALGALLSFLLTRLVAHFAPRSPRRIPAAAAG